MGALVACAIACGSDDDDGPCMSPGAPVGPVRVTIMADRCGITYGETMTFTCTYYVHEDHLPSYVTDGHFRIPRNAFTIVSGESSWVDTVLVNETRKHKVVVRPIVRGDLVADAVVIAPIDSFNAVRGSDSIELHVK